MFHLCKKYVTLTPNQGNRKMTFYEKIKSYLAWAVNNRAAINTELNLILENPIVQQFIPVVKKSVADVLVAHGVPQEEITKISADLLIALHILTAPVVAAPVVAAPVVAALVCPTGTCPISPPSV